MNSSPIIQPEAANGYPPEPDPTGEAQSHSGGSENREGTSSLCTRPYRLIQIHLCGHHRLLLSNESNPTLGRVSYAIETFSSSVSYKKSSIPALDEHVPLDEGKPVYCGECLLCELSAKNLSEQEETRFKLSTSCCLPLGFPQRPSLEFFAMVLRKRGQFLKPTLRQAARLGSSAPAAWNGVDQPDLKQLTEAFVNSIVSGETNEIHGIDASDPLRRATPFATETSAYKTNFISKLKSRQNLGPPALDAFARLRLRLEIYPEPDNTEASVDKYSLSLPPCIDSLSSVHSAATSNHSDTAATNERRAQTTQPTPQNVSRSLSAASRIEHIENTDSNQFSGAVSGQVPSSCPCNEAQGLSSHPPPSYSPRKVYSSNVFPALDGESAGSSRRDDQKSLRSSISQRFSKIMQSFRHARSPQENSGAPVFDSDHIPAAEPCEPTPQPQWQTTASRRQKFAAFLSVSMNRRHRTNASLDTNQDLGATFNPERATSGPHTAQEAGVLVLDGVSPTTTALNSTTAGPWPSLANNNDRHADQAQNTRSDSGCDPEEKATSSSSKYTETAQAEEENSPSIGYGLSSDAIAAENMTTASNTPGGTFLPIITESESSTSSCPARMESMSPQDRRRTEYYDNLMRQRELLQGGPLRRAASESGLNSRINTIGDDASPSQNVHTMDAQELGQGIGDTAQEGISQDLQASDDFSDPVADSEAIQGWNEQIEAMDQLYGGQEDSQDAPAGDDEEIPTGSAALL